MSKEEREPITEERAYELLDAVSFPVTHSEADEELTREDIVVFTRDGDASIGGTYIAIETEQKNIGHTLKIHFREKLTTNLPEDVECIGHGGLGSVFVQE